MTHEATIQRVDTFPTGPLLPDEVAVRVGCNECSLAIAGCYLARGSRTARIALREAVEEALELTDIPGEVKSGGCTTEYEGDCSTICPGNDSQASAIVEEALTI